MVDLQFMFFTGEPELARQAAAAGIERVVVDLEIRGKRERQAGFDTEIAIGNIAIIAAMRRAGSPPLVCRVNGPHPGSAVEIATVLDAGVEWLCFPMLRTVAELRELLTFTGGRARTMAMLETRAALENLPEMLACPVDEFYIGLNDLAIECGHRFAFQFLADPLLAHAARLLAEKPWGVGGMTVLDGGKPLPAAMLLDEYARLGCTRVILRRAFRRDIAGRDWQTEIGALRARYHAARAYPAAVAEAAHARLLAQIREQAA